MYILPHHSPLTGSNRGRSGDGGTQANFLFRYFHLLTLLLSDVFRSVIDVLDDKTVLFVLGDHGMTRTGDHGGDSDDELDAALFVYSKTPLVDNHLKQVHYIIHNDLS